MLVLKLLKKIKPVHIILKKCKWFVLSVKNINAAKKANKLINEDVNLHLMFNDKFNKPIVDFLNTYFEPSKNIFLCKRWFSYPFPEAENVVEVTAFTGIKLHKAKKIICHSLFDEEVINRFYMEKQLLKKAYWIIWGGDLTNKRVKLTKKNKYVFENFKGYCGEADEKYAKTHLNIPADFKFLKNLYPFPLNKKILDTIECPKKDFVQIQIAQSIDISILPVMNQLVRFKNENMRICCVLSYGDSLDVKQKIKSYGQELFGDKFFTVEEYMTPLNYARHIALNDIFILNNDHQDGFGNTLAHLYLGKKVFIRSDIQTPEVLKARGITVFPTQEIQNLSYNDFLDNPYEEINKHNVLSYLDENKLKDSWQEFFDD